MSSESIGKLDQLGPRALWRIYSVLLGAWLIANATPHVVVALTSGKIYYQLSPPLLLVTEASLDLLNFLVPILVVRFYFKEPVRQACGWDWTGWKVAVAGVAGFAVWLSLALLLNRVTHNQSIQYAPIGSGPFSRLDMQAMALMLLVLPAAGEEMMFRGMLQSYLTRFSGKVVGIAVPAILFAVRHHPSDVYFARLNHASAAAWLNRFVGLYALAFILGFVRHRTRSSWASWITHMLIIGTIIIVGHLWRPFLPG